MNPSILNLITDCQASLIEALDRHDIDAIEKETALLSELLEQAKTVSIKTGDEVNPKSLQHAISQSSAASIRVNYLSNWTRQRIDRLAELRGGAPLGQY